MSDDNAVIQGDAYLSVEAFNQQHGVEDIPTPEAPPVEEPVEDASPPSEDNEDVEDNISSLSEEDDEEKPYNLSEQEEDDNVDEAEEEDDSREAKSLNEAYKKGYSRQKKVFFATDSDGNEFEIPYSLKVKKKVDGELRDFTIRDAMNSLAGVETIQKRIDESNALKQELELKTAEINEFQETSQALYREVMGNVEKGNVMQALELIARGSNKPTGDFLKELLTQAQVIGTKLFEQYGDDPRALDSHFQKLNADYYKGINEDKTAQTKQSSEFNNHIARTLQDKGVSEDEYYEAANYISKNNAWAGKSGEDEKNFQQVLQVAGNIKKARLLKTSLGEDHVVLKDKDALNQLLTYVNPYLHTEDDVVALASVISQSISKNGEPNQLKAKSLKRKSPKVNTSRAKSRANSKKQVKTVRSASDIAELHGLSIL